MSLCFLLAETLKDEERLGKLTKRQKAALEVENI